MLDTDKRKKREKFYSEIRIHYWTILHPNVVTKKVKTKGTFTRLWSPEETFTSLNPELPSSSFFLSKFGAIL